MDAATSEQPRLRRLRLTNLLCIIWLLAIGASGLLMGDGIFLIGCVIAALPYVGFSLALRKGAVWRPALLFGFATGCAFLLSFPHGMDLLVRERGHVGRFIAPASLRNLLLVASPALALIQGGFTYLSFRSYRRLPASAGGQHPAITIILWGCAIIWGVVYGFVLDFGFQLFMSHWSV